MKKADKPLDIIMHRVQISPIHRFTDSPIRANFILRIKYIILYTTSARRAQCLSCAFLFLPQKEGLKIVHPCTIFNSSFCKAVRFAKTSITYSVSGIHAGAQASGTDSAARLGDEFALRQTSQISGFKFAILKNCSHMQGGKKC